jgi:putative membrane protein
LQPATAMTFKTLLLAFAIAIPGPAIADQKHDNTTTKKAEKLTEADTKVVAHLHHVNQMEIEMGKLAQKSGTAPVKRYGEMLVRDHSKSDKDVKAFAKKRGLAKIPAVKPETDAEKAEHAKMMTNMAGLKKLEGSDFDREYLRMMVEGHDGELAKTPTFVSTASDADLKTMLENRKTTLQKHSDSARELQRGNAQAVK